MIGRVLTTTSAFIDYDSPLTMHPHPTDPPNTETELERLLQTRNRYPELTEAIDAQIRATFMRTYAILVMDSSGFSRLSQQRGIIAALAEIERLRGVVVPVIQAHQGSVFKIEVDNVYAVFPNVELAIAASHAMIQQAASIDQHVSIGIGYGELLMIAEGDRYRDVYGEEMNLASKLGEDLAGVDEVLLTDAAFANLNCQREQWEKQTMSISSLELQVYRQRNNHSC